MNGVSKLASATQHLRRIPRRTTAPPNAFAAAFVGSSRSTTVRSAGSTTAAASLVPTSAPSSSSVAPFSHPSPLSPSLRRRRRRATMTAETFSGAAPYFFRATTRSFSAVPNDDDGEDNGDDFDLNSLFPVKHSRRLPPPVCPPSSLLAEVEALFGAPVGTLVVYNERHGKSGGGLRSVGEELEAAYLAADGAVQRAEYVLRGLNAAMSPPPSSPESGTAEDGVFDGQSYAAKCIAAGAMAYESHGDGDDGNGRSDKGSGVMSPQDCFRAMLDILDRMEAEGKAYVDLRRRVRSQVVVAIRGNDGSDSSDSDSSDSDSSDSDSDSDDEGRTEKLTSEEALFGASPGTTAHMHELALDALAALCNHPDVNKDALDALVADVVSADEREEAGGENAPLATAPALAYRMLTKALERHALDSGGGGGFKEGKVPSSGLIKGGVSDVRTAPTAMTFNAVLKVAASYGPESYYGKSGGGSGEGGALTPRDEHARDAAIDAAFATYALVGQYSISDKGGKRGRGRKTESGAGVIPGRNSATYAYLLRTVSKCLPPSETRANVASGLFVRASTEDKVMDVTVVAAMRTVAGWRGDGRSANGVTDGVEGGGETEVVESNGANFDEWMVDDMGKNEVALSRGRAMGFDLNSKPRRHAAWNASY